MPNMKDIFATIGAKTILAPLTRTATANGTVIDLQGYKSCLLLIGTGVGGITFDGTNNITWELQDSPDNSTFTDVDITKVVGLSDASLTSGVVRKFSAAHAAASLDVVCYTGGQRYIKLIANFNGTHGTGTLTQAIALVSDSAFQPVNAQYAVAN
jgi:hypothetical protein